MPPPLDFVSFLALTAGPLIPGPRRERAGLAQDLQSLDFSMFDLPLDRWVHDLALAGATPSSG